MDDEDEDYGFAEPETLNWSKNTKFKEIHPDPNVSTLFIFYDVEENPLQAIERWCEDNKYGSASTSNSLGEELLEISKNENLVGLCIFRDGCLSIRLIDQKKNPLLLQFLESHNDKNIESIAEIPHVEEHFFINDGQVEVAGRTGITKTGGFFPRSFYRFTKGKVLVGRTLLGYSESEFCKIGPIILLLEVPKRHRRKGYGTMMVETLEQKMMRHEFPQMYLSDTSSFDFWRKMDYDIDIDEGEKELDYF